MQAVWLYLQSHLLSIWLITWFDLSPAWMSFSCAHNTFGGSFPLWLYMFGRQKCAYKHTSIMFLYLAIPMLKCGFTVIVHSSIIFITSVKRWILSEAHFSPLLFISFTVLRICEWLFSHFQLFLLSKIYQFFQRSKNWTPPPPPPRLSLSPLLLLWGQKCFLGYVSLCWYVR